MLGARCERPGPRRTTDKRNELPAPHSSPITVALRHHTRISGFGCPQVTSGLQPAHSRQLDPRDLPKPLHVRELPRRAMFGLMHRNRLGWPHSNTSSTRASNVGGIVSAMAFAVVRLTTRSNLVGCSTGMSSGLVPRRILSTNSAALRNKSWKFGP